MKPTMPDVIGAADRLRTYFPARVERFADTFKKLNGERKLLPPWREYQILNLLKAANQFAGDLEERYRARRVDSLASAVRNLIELCIWTQYCNLSEASARRFYEDGARDVRELIEAVQALYTAVNGQPEPLLAQYESDMRKVASIHGFSDYDDSYKNVREAAQEVGRAEGFKSLFKVCSKLAHPTSLVLNATTAAEELLDSLYHSGDGLARACLREIEKCVNQCYPDLSF